MTPGAGETRASSCQHWTRQPSEPRLLCGGLHGLGAGGADHPLPHRGAGLPKGHLDRDGAVKAISRLALCPNRFFNDKTLQQGERGLLQIIFEISLTTLPGRSITDFVHPEDRDHLMSQITLNIHQPIDAITETSTIRHKSGNFFCRMRQYSGLKSSSKVRERKKNFMVLKICICFSEVEVAATRRQTVSDGLGIYLFLTAIPSLRMVKNINFF